MCVTEEKVLFGDQNFVSGNLVTSVSHQEVTCEDIELGVLTDVRNYMNILRYAYKYEVPWAW